jgi:hypothetical protein
MVAVASTNATLADLLRRQNLSIAEIAAHLDALPPEARVEQIKGMTGAMQKRLWELAADSPALTFDDMMPPGKQQVRWVGKNSLLAFTGVDKRCYRENGAVVGYNQIDALGMWFAGPGYFTMVKDADKPKELVVDYTKLPTGAPEGWPKIAPNDKGTHTLVYGYLTDYCRKVSEGVFIGLGIRRGKNLGVYFTVARL